MDICELDMQPTEKFVLGNPAIGRFKYIIHLSDLLVICLTSCFEEYPRPTCTKDVCSFLGLMNFYRSHIPNCAERGKALYELTGSISFHWGSAEE